MQVKFPGINKIVGTIYSNMNCDESLREIYRRIAESRKSKKLDNCFAIVAKHCKAIDSSATKTFHCDIANRYSSMSWDEAMLEILNKLPRMSSYLSLEVAKSIVIDACRKADDLKLEEK